jgi:DNA-binding CsgD family transcriptional regulator
MNIKRNILTGATQSGLIWNSPTFKYRHLIKKLVQPLQVIPNFRSISVCLLLKSGEGTWMSSAPKTSLRILAKGLHRGNLLLNYHFASQNRVVFPEEFLEVDELQASIRSICEGDQVYNTYSFTRTCQDCSVLVAVHTSSPVASKLKFYHDTIEQLEHFTNTFLDETLPVYIKELPALAHTRFASDIAYRHRMITARTVSKKDFNLTESELEVLYWSAQGKSADEIALILSLTKNTVDTYRRRIIEKMNVSNITQAVYLASSAGLIV